MSTKRIVVTGAAGHLGSHLAPALVEDGFDITGLDIIEPPCPIARWRCLEVDLTDYTGLASALNGADLIVHCASLHPWKPYTDDQYLDSNIKGTWNVYATAARLGIGAIVLTSSIAAAGYHHVPTDAWPVDEEQQCPLGDLYSFTKYSQEQIARMFADSGKVRTVALRPPAFMPKPELETGFLLTGAFVLVQDIVAAHVAAARLLGRQQTAGALHRAFEAINITNKLPYTREDAVLLGPDGNVRRLVEKHWPRAYQWLTARGYEGVQLPAVYDLTKAERLLGWRPAYNFEQWFAEHGDGPPA